MYGLGVPVILWVVLRYLGVGEWSPVEAVAVFGYGQFVWIPVSVGPLSPQFYFYLNLLFSDSLCHPCADRAVDTSRDSISCVRLLPGSKHIPNSRFGM